jgi:hypothetical protein
MEGGVVMAARQPNARAGVTNDPTRLAPDIDKRTHAGRLFRDLFDSVAAEFPGADPARVREVARLKYELERAQAAGTATLEDTVRVYNLISRREKELRAKARRREVERPEGLRSRLGSKYGGRAP